MPNDNPQLIEITRGAMVESRHRAAFAVADTDGRIVLSAGDFEAPVYARSAIKSLQALPLIESGAADAYALSNAEIALACASHSGEPRHVDTVLAWLTRIDCTVADLECGSHLPKDETAMEALLRSQREATPAHNKCSGKHTGFLSLARHMGVKTKGYSALQHAVQQRILGVLETMTGLDLGAAPRGIDGCGIPVIGIPLGNLALAFARLTDPRDQPEARQAACERVCTAMAAEPFMVA
ncbi:MAG: asparaginase, partial [Alphaproteobacteria bacterium]